MKILSLRDRSIIAGALLVLASLSAGAQDFPTKPITLVVPTASGGSNDLTARALASVAHEVLGQPVLVVLRPGGGGAIASDFVANAAPDGYTLLFGGPTWNTTPPAVEGRSKGPDDLAAVARINYTPLLVAVRSGTPYKSFKEMIEWGKANPGQIKAATLGRWSGTDFFWKQVGKTAGIEVRAVPYEGGGAAVTALLGGHADTTNGAVAVFAPYEKSGRLWFAAITDDKRDPRYPDVPTAKESGVDVTYVLWRGVLAPKGTPRPIIDKLADAFKKMAESPSARELIRKLGDDVQFMGPDEFSAYWRAEFETQKALGQALR